MPLMLSASAGSAGPRGTPAKGKGCRGLPFCARFLNSIRSKTFWRFMRDTWLSNRLIMPNGRSIVLERQPGADVVDAITSNPICALAVLQNGVSKSENEAHTFCL
jgi:hypothetical protein